MEGAQEHCGRGRQHTHFRKGQELIQGHIHSSSRGAHSQALCWVMLGPTAASNVGLPSGGDRFNPRYLRSGTGDEAGSGLTQAQGAVKPKRTEVRGNQERQVQGPQEEHISKSLKATALPCAARAVRRPSGC